MFYLKENITDLIKILRELSEPKKKVVIFAVVIVVGLVLSFFWVKSAAESIAKFPAVNLPSIEIPDLGLENSQTPMTNDQLNPEPENSKTADWTTYGNAEYGFEIKYPKDWQQKNYETELEALLGFCPMADQLCKGTNIYVVIYKEPYVIKDETADYYLGKSETTGFYYYLYNSSTENKEIFVDMISTFKFIK